MNIEFSKHFNFSLIVKIAKSKKRYPKKMGLSSSKTRNFALVNALHLKVPFF